MNEIQIIHDDGAEVVYTIVRNQVGQWYAGATPQAFNVANWATYAIALTEVSAIGAGESGMEQGTFPAAVEGFYWLDVYIRAGATAAQTDLRLSSQLVYWNYSTVVPAQAGILHADVWRWATEELPDNNAVPANVVQFEGSTDPVGPLSQIQTASADALAAYGAAKRADLRSETNVGISAVQIDGWFANNTTFTAVFRPGPVEYGTLCSTVRWETGNSDGLRLSYSTLTNLWTLEKAADQAQLLATAPYIIGPYTPTAGSVSLITVVPIARFGNQPIEGTPDEGSPNDLLQKAATPADVLAQAGAALTAYGPATPADVEDEAAAALADYGAAKTTDLSLLATTEALATGVGAIMDAVAEIPTDPAGLTVEQAAQVALIPAIKAKTDCLGSAVWEFSSPITSEGTIEIVRGDDYAGAAAIVVTVTNYVGPELAGGTAELLLTAATDYNAGVDVATPFAASLSIDGTTVTATITLTAEQTAQLSAAPPAGACNYVYQLVGVASAGNGSLRRTLALGAMTVRRGMVSA